MKPRILLVAERGHWAPSSERTASRWSAAARDDPARWLELSMRLGAFGTGCTGARMRRDGRVSPGERKLVSLAPVPSERWWDECANLLPPSPVAGEWDARLAVSVARELSRLLLLSRFFGCEGGVLTKRWKFDRIALAGRRVSAACCDSGRSLSFFEIERGRFWTIAIPHPSGRSRWWNRCEEEGRLAEARRAMKEFLASGEQRG